MKISVAIIAHNEEKYIAKCLESLTNQTQKPDEIILVAHNCSDQTVELAKKFSEVRVVELQSPDGIPYARQKSIDEASDDIVLCADGDSSYNPNWVQEMTKALQTPGTVGVGGLVWMSGLIGHWMSFSFFFLTPLTKFWWQFYFWGSSMGFYKKDLVDLEPVTRLLALKNELGLNFLADDLFLGLQLLKKRRIRFAKNAVSQSSSRDWRLKDWAMRGISQKSDYLALKKYVTTKTN